MRRSGTGELGIQGRTVSFAVMPHPTSGRCPDAMQLTMLLVNEPSVRRGGARCLEGQP